MENLKNFEIEPIFDAFGIELLEGDIVDVQNAGEHTIYRKSDGHLYFKPYGIEDRVCDYFKDDIIKVNKK